MEQESDTNIPSHEQSAYKLFENEQLDIIKNIHPDWNEKDVISLIQIIWKEMGNAEKKVYLEKLEQPNKHNKKEDVSTNEIHKYQEETEQQYLVNVDKRLKLTVGEEEQNS
ncbi:MAG: hypothetical protein EZS28_052335, partial [Streblomastix strix]